MHYCVFVMIEPDSDIETSVMKAMEPFDEALEVEPYRIHFNYEEVQRMAKFYNIDPADLHALAAKMEDWTNHEGGVDRQGLYQLTNFNPDGRWDWYEIGGRWDGYIPGAEDNVIPAGKLMNDPQLKNRLPYFVLTPDGEWLEHERFYIVNGDMKTERFDDEAWLAEVRNALQQWPTHDVVVVDIHC